LSVDTLCSNDLQHCLISILSLKLVLVSLFVYVEEAPSALVTIFLSQMLSGPFGIFVWINTAAVFGLVCILFMTTFIFHFFCCNYFAYYLSLNNMLTIMSRQRKMVISLGLRLCCKRFCSCMLPTLSQNVVMPWKVCL
jgi:hypothetical protein